MLDTDSDGSEEKAITALGILNTMETILTVMEEHREVRCSPNLVKLFMLSTSEHEIYPASLMLKIQDTVERPLEMQATPNNYRKTNIATLTKKKSEKKEKSDNNQCLYSPEDRMEDWQLC